MQVARRPAHRDFKRDDAAQRVGERGMIGIRHPGVRNDDGIAGEFTAMGFKEFREVRAADFLLAFDDEGQITGQGSSRFEIGFNGFEVREVLAFVVGRAAGEKRSARDARLERRRFPQFKRLRRLNIVVPVNHEVRFPAFATLWRGKSWGLGDDDGMAGGRTNRRFKADLTAMVCEPSGAGAQIIFVLRLRRDAGKAEEFAQFGDEAGLVAFEVIQNQLHGDQLNRETRACQAEPAKKFGGCSEHTRLDRRHPPRRPVLVGQG